MAGLDCVAPTCRLSCQHADTSQSPVLTGFRYLCSLMHVCVAHAALIHLFLCGWCSRTWNWQFALTLQEGSVGIDELVRWDIAY